MRPRALLLGLAGLAGFVTLRGALSPPVDLRPPGALRGGLAGPRGPVPVASPEYEPACDLLASRGVLDDYIGAVEELSREAWALAADVESLWADWKRYGEPGRQGWAWRGVGAASARTPERVRAERIHAGIFRLYEGTRRLYDDAYLAMAGVRDADGAWRRLSGLPADRLPPKETLAGWFHGLGSDLERLGAALNALDAGIVERQEELDEAYADVRRHLLAAGGTVPSLLPPSHWERLAAERPRPDRRYDFPARYAGHWRAACPGLPPPGRGYWGLEGR